MFDNDDEFGPVRCCVQRLGEGIFEGHADYIGAVWREKNPEVRAVLLRQRGEWITLAVQGFSKIVPAGTPGIKASAISQEHLEAAVEEIEGVMNGG